MMRFTTRTIATLRPKDGAYWVNDSALPGFRVKVLASGVKSFAVRLRSRGGRKNRSDTMQVIGRFETLTVDQARAQARILLSRIALGEDPAGEQRAERRASTVDELAAAFLEEREGKTKPSTLREYARMYQADIAPAFGKKTARDLTRHEVARLHHSLRATPYLANRVRSLIGAMYRWGEVRGILPDGIQPTRGVEAFPEEGRERYLTEEELARLGNALRKAERTGIAPDPKRAQLHAARHRKSAVRGKQKRTPLADKGRLSPANPYAISAIRLLLLTGMREQEVLSLQWSSIDLDGARLRLPDTKTGLSWRPLGGAAVQLLREVPRMGQSAFVFPGRDAKHPLTDIKHVWQAVRYEAGLPDLRLHDLRHHFASTGAQHGLSLVALGAVLGHRELATTRKYAHLGDDPMKRAADQISASVAAGIAPVDDRARDETRVMPIRRGRR
jgi:integrase